MQKQNLIRFSAILATVLILAVGYVPVCAETSGIPQRSEIDPKYQWDVDIYPDLDAWEADFTFLKENISRIDQFRGRLGESPETFLECTKLSDELWIRADNLYVYANLKLDEDTRISTYQELAGRSAGIRAELSEATAFVEPELLTLNDEKLRSYVTASEELKVYSHYIDNLIRQKEHILSAKEEALLALAGPALRASSEIFNRLTDADMTYGSIYDEDSNLVELTNGRYSRFMDSPDRRVRRDASNTHIQAYVDYANTLAATLAASVKRDYFLMKARGYNSCLEMAMDQNNIPTAVYQSLIEAVNANLPTLHRLATLRKKVMGIDTLYRYDLYVPIAAASQKTYTYDEAVELNLKGLAPLGEEYVSMLKKGFESNWIDVYETEGKSSGGYEWGTYTSHPFILLNFNGTMDWVSAISHEMGHALHDHYAYKTQPYVYADYSLFLAEIASTTNEALFMRYMIDHADTKEEKIALLNSWITAIKGTFFTQVMFSEFEQAIHDHIENGGAFSADYFRKTYRDIYQKYWGPDLVIQDIDDISGLRIGHFYRRYYVYQYATGLAAAQVMSQRILNEGEDYLDDYFKFLKAGSSKYPVDVLKDAGVDMTSPETYEVTIQLFSSLIDELEQLLDEK